MQIKGAEARRKPDKGGEWRTWKRPPERRGQKYTEASLPIIIRIHPWRRASRATSWEINIKVVENRRLTKYVSPICVLDCLTCSLLSTPWNFRIFMHFHWRFSVCFSSIYLPRHLLAKRIREVELKMKKKILEYFTSQCMGERSENRYSKMLVERSRKKKHIYTVIHRRCDTDLYPRASLQIRRNLCSFKCSRNERDIHSGLREGRPSTACARVHTYAYICTFVRVDTRISC